MPPHRAGHALGAVGSRIVLNGGERRRSSPMPPHRTSHALGADHALGYLPEASTSKKRSYMTEPTFHLPRVFEVA
jgi:hypothetical protein